MIPSMILLGEIQFQWFSILFGSDCVPSNELISAMDICVFKDNYNICSLSGSSWGSFAGSCHNGLFHIFLVGSVVGSFVGSIHNLHESSYSLPTRDMLPSSSSQDPTNDFIQ